MATQTDYFHLKKPESYENYNIAVFNDNADTIDLQMHNNQVSAAKVMVGATSLADGESGRVPTPHAGDEDKFLKGDGTWAEAGSSNVEANPSGTPTDTLETIGINNVIYQLPEGGDTEITGDAEGSIIAIDDGKLNAPLKACTVDINPVQSGSGTPSPSNIRPISGWDAVEVVRTGKNLLNVNSRVNQTTASVVYTSDANFIIMNGTKQGGGYADLSSLTLTLPAGTYYAKAFAISGSATSNINIYPFDGSNNIVGNILNEKKSFTLSEQKTFYFRFAVWTDGSVFTDYKLGIIISISSEIDTYEPCTGTTYPITLPSTVYGGLVDVTSGTGIKNRAKVKLSTVNAFSSDAQNANGFIRFNCVIDDKAYNFNILSDKLEAISSVVPSGVNSEVISGSSTNNRFYFAINANRLSGDLSTSSGRNLALKDWLSNNEIEVVYELATPTEVSLTPTEITTLHGNNVFWADSGDMAITYVRDTSIAINDALNQSITPTYSSGTKIADYNVGGQTGAIYVQGAGGHMDTLWTGNETPTMSYNPTIQLAHPISDYDLILVNFNIHNGAGTYLKATLPLYGATVGDNFAQEFLTTNGAIMFVNILNNYNITLNCYGGSYENTTYVSIIGVKL